MLCAIETTAKIFYDSMPQYLQYVYLKGIITQNTHTVRNDLI